MSNLLPTLLVPILSTLAARPVAPPAPDASRVEVELVEKIGAAKRARTEFVLVSDGYASSSLEHSDHERRCEAKIAPVRDAWHLELECRPHGRGPAELEVAVSARVPRGKRTVVASMERPDGTKVEVALTVR
jgi:hypothetical protein